MKISIIEPLEVKQETLDLFFEPVIKLGFETVFYNDKTNDTDTLISRCQDADIVIVCNTPLSKDVLCKCKKLKYINVAFTGCDHIDLAYCRQKGIKVSNCAGYSNTAVSELVFGLIISLYRHLNEGHQRVINEQNKAGLIGQQLERKKFGIIGFGKIGSQVNILAKAFGCETFYYSRSYVNTSSCNYLPLNELLATCDIISLHVPLTDATFHMIDKEQLSLMKSNAIIINTARGAVINNEELAKCLNNEQIAGAGIDVFDIEPPLAKDYCLLNAKNCIFTPHVGFYTAEAMEKRAEIMINNLYSYLNNEQQNIIV